VKTSSGKKKGMGDMLTAAVVSGDEALVHQLLLRGTPPGDDSVPIPVALMVERQKEAR
jgi:hypothetical protein